VLVLLRTRLGVDHQQIRVRPVGYPHFGAV
jgi:hypothetical protein